MIATPDLIESLAARARPVGRLRPPLLRAVAWLSAFALLLAIAVSVMNAWTEMGARLQQTRFMLEMTGTVLTGVAAVVAAFFLALPDRSRFWALLPLPPLALWLAASGYGCLVNWAGGTSAAEFARSSECFVTIVVVSVPLGVALYVAIRRAVPLDPVPVLAIGGLGVAALAAVALQFFHPFDVTVVDLGLHLVAVLIVVAAMVMPSFLSLLRSYAVDLSQNREAGN
jgi:hypothetical protein